MREEPLLVQSSRSQLLVALRLAEAVVLAGAAAQPSDWRVACWGVQGKGDDLRLPFPVK